MYFQDAFKTANRSLLHSKMRTALTMLGIIVGIASVIVLMSIGQSAQDLILSQVQGIGSNLVFVIPGGSTNGRLSSPASAQGIVIASLVDRDVDSLSREPSVSAVLPEVRGQASAVYDGNNVTVTYQGEIADFFPVRNFTMQRGSPFTKSDVDSYNNVAVIGPTLAETLFGTNIDPINKTIRLKNLTFRIVGVLDKKGTGPLGVDQDNLVVIPVTIAQKELLGISYFNDFTIQANPSYDINFVKSRITFALRRDHGITDPNKDDFTIRTQEDALALLGNITSILTLFLAAIASISLVVGGIGIMNIMLVSVTERTKEIGLRKSVGATDGDILQQFLIESILLTFAGGIIGILTGAALVGLIYLILANFTTVGWGFAFPISAVVMGLLVATGSGVIFGIYPAYQAGKKNPIDALRYE